MSYCLILIKKARKFTEFKNLIINYFILSVFKIKILKLMTNMEVGKFALVNILSVT